MVGQRHESAPSSGSPRRKLTGLSQLHRRRIAVMLNCKGKTIPFCGTGSFECDEALGNVLRIRLDDAEAEGSPEVVISEEEWDGQIIPDDRHGCHFCLIPSPKWPPG